MSSGRRNHYPIIVLLRVAVILSGRFASWYTDVRDVCAVDECSAHTASIKSVATGRTSKNAGLLAKTRAAFGNDRGWCACSVGRFEHEHKH